MTLAQKLKLDPNKLYYLASPYSHPDPNTRQARFESIEFIATLLIIEGIQLIEPIGMCHSKSLKYDLPSGYDYWKNRDRAFIERCDGIILTRLEGWKRSKGMEDEAKYAYDLHKEIVFIDEEHLAWDEFNAIVDIYTNALSPK